MFEIWEKIWKHLIDLQAVCLQVFQQCLKKMEWTIIAFQPRKETCCCVSMNAHGLQFGSLAGSLPGYTTLIVVYLPAVLAWMHMASNSKAWLAAWLATVLLLLFLCQQIEKEDYNFLALEWQCRSESNIHQNVTPWGPEGLACPPPSALERWSGQSRQCSHANRLAAVLAWMHMASNSKA